MSFADESEAAMVLPSMTVFGIKKADDTYTQVSEVEWHYSNDKSIVKESDGSYTVKTTTNPYSLQKLMVSLGRPVVKIDLRYAKRSSSMTADGDSTFNKLVDALKHLGGGARVELTPTVDGASSGARALMQRRLEELVRSVRAELDVDIIVKPHKVQYSKSKRSSKAKVSTFDLWRIRIQQLRSQ